MLRSILVILFVIKVALVWSQSSREPKALKELSKQQWDKSRSRYSKMLKKDTLDVEGYYIKSLYFFSPDNPSYNLDTAYLSVNKSLHYYESLTLREREKLQKVPIDSTLLRNIRKQIDSAAFVRAKDEGTEAAYAYFLEKFPTSVNYGEGLQLLHEVAFETALHENTYEAFDQYLKKYQSSHRATEARENYDRLYFETKTGDQRLATYRNFLFNNPRSPYVEKVREQIMEISTANGDPETFRNFIRNFPQSHSTKKASDILYYLVKEEDFTSIPSSTWSDSLTNIYQQNRHYLAPYYESGLFGFMDGQGTEIIPASAEEIDQEYLCGNIAEDVLVFQKKVITRNGAVLFPEDIQELNDLGYGYLFIVTNGGRNVVFHKSGFEIKSASPIEDARLLSGKFISLKCNGHWSLHTLSGKLLIEGKWDDIKAIGSVLVFKKNNKWHLMTSEDAALIADQHPSDFSTGYDEIKLWPDKELIWVRNDNEEGLLNEKLEVKLPLENRTLKSFHNGMESQEQDSTMLYTNAGEDCGYFEEIKTNQYWVSVRQENKWRLYAVSDKSFLSPAFDSIAYKGIFAIGQVKDSVVVYFDHKKTLKFKNVRADFIATSDSSSYLLITSGKVKSLYNVKSEKLFESTYDNIQFADKGTFVVTRNNKRGLVSESGKTLLPLLFDGIGDGDGKYIPLLKNTKFGLYNLTDKHEIKPWYDKNLRKYNETLFVAFKNDSYGIIDSKSKQVLPFDYEDVRYWNDSSAFVKANFVWQLFDLKNSKVILDNVKDFKFIAESQNEKIAIVRANNYYGVLSTLNGVVIPITFTDIVNVGSPEEPLYFTEKHVEEASIYVVIYYDKEGKLLRRYVYDPDEYEKIYCSNN